MSNTKMEIKERYQVVITSHNCAYFLKRCLESVDKIFKNKNWILIFIDDGSTDHTEEELESVDEEYLNSTWFEIHEHEEPIEGEEW